MNTDEIQRTESQLGIASKPGPKSRTKTLVETGVMLNKAERDALDKLAQEAGKSRSEMIRLAVRKVWLKKKAN